MTDPSAGQEDEWLYGESADSVKEDLAAIAAKEDGAVTENEQEGTSASMEDLGDTAQAATNEDTVESNDAGDQETDETRGRKRSAEGENISSDEREAGEGEESEDDDDSDDDGVMVTIGDIKAQGSAPGFGKRAGAPPPDKKGKFSNEDFDGPGHINGVPAQDFNLDALEDKPWRKPGADITDYFNYGFTEDTWRSYSDRQKRLRYEAGAGQGHQGQGDVKYIGGTGPQNIIFPKKFGMQGQQRKDGPMNMMGMGMGMPMGMRRDNHSENTIQVMTADRREYSRKQFEMGPPMMGPPFDMSIPPPPFPPRGGDFMGPPEFFNHPPNDYYDEEPEYEEQQWMDSQWEMEGDGGRVGPGPSTLVVPLTKVTEVPPPPGDAPEEGNSAVEAMKVESS